MAPSTLGSFLRAFSFGHVRQLDAVIAESLRRAWALGTGPGATRLVVDVDSTICQVYGRAKSGAAYGYTKVLGYHPIVAVRAGSGEILHARMRKGSANTARGPSVLSKSLLPGRGEQGRAARSSCALTRAFGPMPPSPSWDAWTCASPWPCAVGTAPLPAP